MNGPERAAAAESTAAVVSRINDTVADVGSALRDRVKVGLRPLGPVGILPVQAIEGQHRLVHRLIGIGAKGAGRAAATGLENRAPVDAPSIHDDPENVASVAALRAAFGDTLPEALNPPIRVYRATDDPETGALAVFVHGLGGHDLQWSDSYVEFFAEAGYTCIQVRYSTGRSISENGMELAEVLTSLVEDEWPQPVTDMIFVGHSMGGLVITEALAAESGRPLIPLVTDVVTLGAPFGGAPLERFARSALAAGSRSSVAAPILALGDHRSIGIKELGDGITTSLPEGVQHHAVVAGLGESPESVASRLLGDGMVPQSSAKGHHAHRDGTTIHHVTPSSHIALLDHPQVKDLLEQHVGPKQR